eukprot:tig00001304_g8104.t1
MEVDALSAVKREGEPSSSAAAKRARTSPPEVIVISDSDDSDIETVSPPRDNARVDLRTPSAAPRDDENDEGGEIRVTGAMDGLAQMAPHSRQYCLKYKHVARSDPGNKEHCEKCCCWVCDKPVAQCVDWSNHCAATDSSPHWAAERARLRRINGAGQKSSSSQGTSVARWLSSGSAQRSSSASSSSSSAVATARALSISSTSPSPSSSSASSSGSDALRRAEAARLAREQMRADAIRSAEEWARHNRQLREDRERRQREARERERQQREEQARQQREGADPRAEGADLRAEFVEMMNIGLRGASSSSAPAATLAVVAPQPEVKPKPKPKPPAKPPRDVDPCKYAGHIDFVGRFGPEEALKAALEGLPADCELDYVLRYLRFKDDVRTEAFISNATPGFDCVTGQSSIHITTLCEVATEGTTRIKIRVHVFVKEAIYRVESDLLCSLLLRIVPCVPESPAAVGPFLPVAMPPPERVRSAAGPDQTVRKASEGKPCISWGDEAGVNVNRLFKLDALMESVLSEGYREEEQPEGLAVELRNYQRQSLAFMLDRERSTTSLAEDWHTALTLADGQRVLICPVTGEVHLEGHPQANFAMPQARGGILAEEMGLGKTVELLALVLKNRIPAPAPPEATPTVNNRAKSRATLIVCPVSLLGQWKQELKRKLTEPLDVYVYHTGRTSDPKQLLDHDVVLTTYSIVQRDGDASALHCIDWHRIVLDECHYIKNKAAAGTKAIAALRTGHKWCVSGTPVQTKVDDLHQLLCFLEVAPFTSPTVFARRVQKAYERGCRSGALLLRTILRHCMMRHVKTQRINGVPLVSLPPKEHRTVMLELAPHERTLYGHLFGLVKPQFDTIAVDNYTLRTNYMTYTSLLLPLRSFCSDAGLLPLEKYLPEAHRGKRGEDFEPCKTAVSLAAVVEWLQAANPRAEGLEARVRATGESLSRGEERCAICLDAITTPTFTLCGHVFCRDCVEVHVEVNEEDPVCPTCRKTIKKKDLKTVSGESIRKLKPEGGPLPAEAGEEGGEGEGEGAESPQASFEGRIPAEVLQAHAAAVTEGALSTKVAALMAALEEMREKDPTSKAVVFTQFNATFERIVRALRQRDFGFVRIDGGMPAGQRARALEKFETDPGTTCFVLSIRSGAVGLTLTAADHCFVLEPCMNGWGRGSAAPLRDRTKAPANSTRSRSYERCFHSFVEAGTEEQAVNRIYRLGQTRPVHITCFATKDTVESRILESSSSFSFSSAAGAVDDDPPYSEAGPSAPRRRRGRPAHQLPPEQAPGSIRGDKPVMRVDEWRKVFSPY